MLIWSVETMKVKVGGINPLRQFFLCWPVRVRIYEYFMADTDTMGEGVGVSVPTPRLVTGQVMGYMHSLPSFYTVFPICLDPFFG